MIVAAYDAPGAAVEAAEAAVKREDLVGRWRAVPGAVRSWALANPNGYALIYGSPVPGYVPPPDTVAPATRVSCLIVRILVDALTTGRLAPALPEDRVPARVWTALDPLRSFVGVEVPGALTQRGLRVWTALYGTISFELFGQLHDVIGEEARDREVILAGCVGRWAGQVGLA